MSRSFHYTFDDAVQKSSLRPPIRHLLMVIAAKTNRDGHIPDRFQPSVTELARRTGMTRRTVLRVIVEAEEAGWLQVKRPTKRAAREDHESNRYALRIPTGLVSESHQPSDTQPLVNRPGKSGDSVPWEGWSHVRKYVEEVPGRAA